MSKYINKIKCKPIRLILLGATHICIITFLAFVFLCLFMFILFLGVFIIHVIPYMIDKLISGGILLKIFGTFSIFILLSYIVGKCVEFFNKDR